MPGVGLFTWLQDAAFYRNFHIAAAELLGPGGGHSWLDVGTGPGLLARLAAERGYRATGIDRDPGMIEAARQLAAARNNTAHFAATSIEDAITTGQRHDVVSASSLVVVTPDPEQTISQLLALTTSGGRLLIIEASPQMTRRRALRLVVSGRLGRRGTMLIAWAMARSGRTLDQRLIRAASPSVERHELLHGLVNAWVLEASP